MQMEETNEEVTLQRDEIEEKKKTMCGGNNNFDYGLV